MSCFKVGAAINHRASVSPEYGIDDLKPVPILKTCLPPCHNSNPCMRICSYCPDRPKYPNIDAFTLTFFDKDSRKCSHISSRTAGTLFGNKNGRLLKYSHIYLISLFHNIPLQ